MRCTLGFKLQNCFNFVQDGYFVYNLNFLFYSLLSFSFSFRRKRKWNSAFFECSKKAKMKPCILRMLCDHTDKNARKSRLAFWVAEGCYCGHFYKNARKTLAFSGCFFWFLLILSLSVLREQLGSISCTKNREPAYASVFSASRLKSTTVFLSSFWFIFSSFFLERRKKNERRKRNYKV